MKGMRNDGKMGIAFNNRMIMPDDFLDIVNASKLRHLEDNDVPAMIKVIS